MGILEKGLVQLFFGHGKGKTSCAIGGAIRMLGHGGRVLMVQMLKAEGGEEDEWFHYGELRTIERLPGFEVRQFGLPRLIPERTEPAEADRRAAREAMEFARREAASGAWDMVIVDELTEAWNFGIVSIDEMLVLLDARHPQTELVLTGRFAPPELVGKADLVTELRQVKHPYEKGIGVRRGIEF